MPTDPIAFVNRPGRQFLFAAGIYFAATLLSLSLATDLISADTTSQPQSAKLEQGSFQLADPNLVIELVAAEPAVQSPVAIAWDAEGRLYVAEMIGYPQEKKQGRIRRLEDLDGDGCYENATVFAEGLHCPTSVMPFADSVLVTDAPDILRLRDTDNDGIADEQSVEWTGFGTGSEQLRANSLHWGLDNWIYGANGRCNGLIRRPHAASDTAVSIRARDFRFDPQHGDFQTLAGQSQFGQSHNRWGDRFLCWNTIPIRQAVIPDLYLAMRPDLTDQSVIDCARPQDTAKVYSISPPPRQFNGERADYYNALGGLTILRDQGLGKEYQGDAFVSESLANTVLRRKLARRGPEFVAQRVEQEQEFLASTDGWFHPVNLTTGPDGALYVVDFYREYVEHPRYVASDAVREGINWQRGHEHGRIWRIRRNTPERSQATQVSLSEESTQNLVQTLWHENSWWRDTAQRLLIERNDSEAIPVLRRAIAAGGRPEGQLHAMWTLHGLGGLDVETLLLLLGSDHPQLRRGAVRLAAPLLAEERQINRALQKLVADPDPAVRFELALALTANANDQFHDLLTEMAATDYHDPWISRALLRSDRVLPLLRQLATKSAWQGKLTTAQREFLLQAGESLGRQANPESLVRLLDFLADAREHVDNQESFEIVLLAGIAQAFAKRGLSLKSWIGNYKLAIRQSFAAAIREAAQTIGQASWSLPLQVATIQLLASGPADLVAQPLEKVLRLTQREPVREAAARALADLDALDASRRLYTDWPRLPTSLRRKILLAAARSPASRSALLEALRQGTVLPMELPITVEKELRDTGSAVQRQQFVAILGGQQQTDRNKTVADFLDVADMTGDVTRGAAHFKQHCLACHTLLSTGKQVGPDLSGAGRRSKKELLVDILNPSGQVSPDYLAYTATTHTGKVLTGLIVAETDSSLTLHGADGKSVTLAHREIEELHPMRKSLMPDGIEEKIGRQGLADLIAFLRNPHRALLE